MARRPIAAGNWKMHKLPAGTTSFCRELRHRLSGETAAEVVLFPSFPLLPAMAAELAGSQIAFGGQDLHPEPSGAHTGDVAGEQLAAVGCRWVLVGHSERRHDHGEGDQLAAAKVRAAARAGLTPVLCLGETQQQRHSGDTLEILALQLAAAVAAAPAGLVVAYEPVWAIGTGDTATPEQAQEAHAFLRQRLAAELDDGRAAATRLLYGGSVKPGNAAELIAQPDIDGFLVGGASLEVDSFAAIIAACGRRPG